MIKPKGYVKLVSSYSQVIAKHSYDKKTGYVIELKPGWEADGEKTIKTTRITTAADMFKNLINTNQMTIYDFL